MKPVNPKGNQPWIFIARADAEAPILWPPDVKNRLIGKDPDAGKDWRQEEKGTTEDEKFGWHHRLNGHEFEQALGVGNGLGKLAYCSPWGCKDSDTTERLYWTVWACSPPGSSVCGFSRQEYCSGLPFPPPGDLPNPCLRSNPRGGTETFMHWLLSTLVEVALRGL